MGIFSSDQDNYKTFWPLHDKFKNSLYRTNMYGKNSIKASAKEF